MIKSQHPNMLRCQWGLPKMYYTGVTYCTSRQKWLLQWQARRLAKVLGLRAYTLLCALEWSLSPSSELVLEPGYATSSSACCAWNSNGPWGDELTRGATTVTLRGMEVTPFLGIISCTANRLGHSCKWISKVSSPCCRPDFLVTWPHPNPNNVNTKTCHSNKSWNGKKIKIKKISSHNLQSI